MRSPPRALLALIPATVVAVASCGGGEPRVSSPAPPEVRSPRAPARCASDTAESEPSSAVPGTAASEPDRTGFQRLQVRWAEAAGLDYLEIVAGDVDPDAPLPLVLGLHGLGDKPRVPEDARLGDGIPYRIVMPRAPEPSGHHGYTWLPVRVRDGKVGVLCESLRERAELLAEFLRAVRRQRPTVGRPVVTGGSQGGMLTFTLAVHHPDVVAAAVPVMGWLPPPLVPEGVEDAEAYPPIYAVHGEADRVIPVDLDREGVDALQRLGLDVRFETYEGVGHHMTAAMDEQVQTWLARMLRAQLATGRRPAWH
ncbi:MAG: alpha/beta hydrolase [Myxococcota bacterium]